MTFPSFRAYPPTRARAHTHERVPTFTRHFTFREAAHWQHLDVEQLTSHLTCWVVSGDSEFQTLHTTVHSAHFFDTCGRQLHHYFPLGTPGQEAGGTEYLVCAFCLCPGLCGLWFGPLHRESLPSQSRWRAVLEARLSLQVNLAVRRWLTKNSSEAAKNSSGGQCAQSWRPLLAETL